MTDAETETERKSAPVYKQRVNEAGNETQVY